MKATHAWGDATIKTLLHRLIQKGAVRSEKQDGRQLYHAVLDRPTYLDGEIRLLVDRLFDGRPEALVEHLRRGPGGDV